MTSDTKIGLLLGLVFIFVIAFLINGLPSFRTKTHGNYETARLAGMGSQGLGIATPERAARNLLSPDKGLQEDVQRSPVFQGLQQYTAPSAVDSRGQYGLPPSTTLQLEQDIQRDAVHAVAHLVPSMGSTAPSAVGTGTVRRGPVTHIVEENDNLALIAKRYYGESEGNRRVNLERIFKANRAKLRSPDEIRIGQRLVIPPLEQGTLATEFVPVIPTKPAPKSIAKKAKPNSAMKSYQVKQGDSLWNIAETVFGDGSRYLDIIRLNKDLLKDENNLSVGTRLRLPAR